MRSLAIAEAVLIWRAGAAVVVATAVLFGALAIVQEPAFARRADLDIAWASIESLAVLVLAGVLPWQWLQAHLGSPATPWETRAVPSAASRVLAAWLAMVASVAAAASVDFCLLFALDRVSGGGVPWQRAAAVVVRATGAAAVLAGFAISLRWLDAPLPLRLSAWGATVALVLTGPVAGAEATAPSTLIAPTALALAGLFAGHALLLRRLAIRH